MSNLFYYTAGLIFLLLAKAKNVLMGYSTPKPFGLSDAPRCAAYDVKVVDDWLRHLDDYAGRSVSLAGKTVLELGPGSDLGTGMCLLTRGADRYLALDVNDLATRAPDDFYRVLIETIKEHGGGSDFEWLVEQLRSSRLGLPSRLNYVVRGDFDIVAAFGTRSVDLVFSQVAFEHFDDPESVVAQLSKVCKSGALFVSEIDLQTHSRWIREADPNNIYRYSDAIYGLFRFRGSPNRMRPRQYNVAFERHGWTNVVVRPLSTLDRSQLGKQRLSRRFRDDANDMYNLSVVLCATKE